MTDRGHGALGLVDYLRTFADLLDDPASARRPFLDFQPGITLAGTWSAVGGAYLYNGYIAYTLGGATLDVVGVETALGALVRVETLAECQATAGTYYAAPNVAPDGAAVVHWDDGSQWDQAGKYWDATTTIELYVHLAGGASPTSTTVVPLLGLTFGARGEVHPQLGPEKLSNGGFESGLTGWTTSISPGWDDGSTHWDDGTLWDGGGFSPGAVDATLYFGRGSVQSIKLVSNGASTGESSIYQDKATVADERYLLAGYYRTDPAFSGNLSARLLVGKTDGSAWLYEDGRDADSSGFAALRPTYGEWRRFFFTILAPATTTRVRLQLRAPSSAGAGQLNFDGVTLKRIYRFAYYEPRLAADSLPEVEVGSQSIFFAGKKDGQGSFRLINADGALEAFFAQLLLHGRPASIFVGGSFADGQEVYRDDWRGAWPGRAQKVVVTDGGIDFDADDARDLLHVDLPLRKHSLADEPDLNLADEGYGRPILFNDFIQALLTGNTPPTPANVGMTFKAARVGLTENGYGIYEIADGESSLAGLSPAVVDPYGPLTTPRQSPNVIVYPSEDLAEKDQLGFRFLAAAQAAPGLFPQQCFSYDAATGRITVLDDIRNYAYGRDGALAFTMGSNAIFQFDVGGSILTASVVAGFGVAGGSFFTSAAQLANLLQDDMRAKAGVSDIFVTYSHTTHKFTISKTAGSLNLRAATGSLAYLKHYDIIGFDASTDYTGSLSYTGAATFTSPEADHVLRFQSYGLVDDASGTITGTPGTVIVKHAHVARYVLRAFLQVPESQIDGASFDAGAALETTGLVGVLLRDVTSSRDFLARLESGALADLVIDGDAVWRWKPYVSGAAVVQAFFDRDFLDFEVSKDPATIFSSARVTYGQAPALGSEKTYEYVADAGVPTKHGRREVLDAPTWIGASSAAGTAAQLLCQRLARLAASDPRFVRFSARGKVVDLLQGDIITITRARGMDSTGALAAVRFRVLDLRQNVLSGIGTCYAVEDVSFLS